MCSAVENCWSTAPYAGIRGNCDKTGERCADLDRSSLGAAPLWGVAKWGPTTTTGGARCPVGAACVLTVHLFLVIVLLICRVAWIVAQMPGTILITIFLATVLGVISD